MRIKEREFREIKSDLARCFYGDLKANPKVGIVITELSRKLFRLQKGVDTAEAVC